MVTRDDINRDLDRATKNGLMERDYVRHHFTLRKDYIYIHVSIHRSMYEWARGLHTDVFSTSIRIPTEEYSYRRLASALRKAKKEHEAIYG